MHSFGLAVVLLAVLMTLAGSAGLLLGDKAAAWAFLLSALITLFCGGGLMLATSRTGPELTNREGYVLLFVFWLGLPLFAALPLWLGPWSLPPLHALFEAVSALTTTGLSVLDDPRSHTPSLLLWRALLQWAGGLVGVILLVVVLVYLHVGGLQLFQNALPHGEGGGSLIDRLFATAKDLLPVYTGLTAVCGFCLWLAGLSGFDALCLALSTLSTGGLVNPTAAAALAHPLVQLVLVVFMIIAALNLTTLWALAHRRRRALRQDPEARYLPVTIGVLVVLMTLVVLYRSDLGPLSAFKEALFLTVSGMTTTAFIDPSAAYVLYVSPVLVIGLMFVGGSSGSTTGGMRLLRIAVLFKQARRELYRLNHPHGVLPLRIGERRIDHGAMRGVWSYFFALVFFTALTAMILGSLGLAPMAAIAGAVASLTNAGPFAAVLSHEFGQVSTMSDAAMAVLMAAMLTARLELLTLLVLLYPSYWRR